MSLATIAPMADADVEQRWRLWQLSYAASNRRTAARGRIVLGVVLTAVGGWLILQLVSGSVR